MSVGKSNGPIIDPALCRCCRAIKKCRILTAEYTWMGKKEIYADMVMDCYGILLSHVDDNEKDSGVCATCVVRLREAIAFRHQVLQCEELFLQAKLEDHHEDEKEDENKLKKLDLELKTEPKDYNSDHNSMDDRDNDPCPAYSEDDNDDIKPLKKEKPKPEEPLPLKDEELKSEESIDYNGDSTSDSDEPIKKKMKRKAKSKANGAKKKPAKGIKKQKAETEVTEAKHITECEGTKTLQNIKLEPEESEETDNYIIELEEMTNSGEAKMITIEVPVEIETITPDGQDSNKQTTKMDGTEGSSKKKRVWCRTARSEGSKYQILQQKLEADENLYFEHYNMSKSSFEELHDMLESSIEKMHTNYRSPIVSRERLAVCLRYLKTGDSCRVVATYHGMGRSTVSSTISEVAQAIWDVLQPKYMPIPNKDTWIQSEAGFRELWEFPNCIGSITGKHIVLKNTIKNPEKFPSPVLLAIVDPFYNFITIDIGDYGGEAEGSIVECAEFYKDYFQDGFVLPQKPLPGIARKVPHVLIGDNGFNLKPFLMRAYPSNTISKNPMQGNFNRHLLKARTSDAAFAMLLDNWKLFQKPMGCHITCAVHVVKAACCLHNYLRSKHNTIPSSINVDVKYYKNRKKTLKGLSPFKPSNQRATHRAQSIRHDFATYFSNLEELLEVEGVSGVLKVEPTEDVT